jgi:hypothetical protein
MIDSQDSVNTVAAGVAESVRDSFTRAATHFVECLGGRDAAACVRLPGEAVDQCRIEGAQLRARATNAPGWAMPEPLLAMCRGSGASEADCRRYGEAIETGNSALCAGLPAAAADCPALAAGDPARCASIPNVDRSCAEQAAKFAQLRRGGRELANTPGRFQSFARGLTQGPEACATAFRSELAAAMPAPQAAPAENPPPAEQPATP